MSKIKIKKFTNNLTGYNFVFAQYKMSLKFGEIKLNKKEFHRSKEPVYLNQVAISKIAISDEFKLDDGVKNVIGYKNDENLNHYVLFYFKCVDLLNILKTRKKYILFG